MIQVKKLNASHGFSLVELMIALAITGILAAIVYPSYKSQLRSSQRANAQAQLSDCSQKFERQFAGAMNYSSMTVANSGSAGTCVLTMSGMATSSGALYNVTLNSASGAYAIIAVPNGDQAKESCQSLCVDSQGNRLAGAGTFTSSPTSCSLIITTPISGCW